MTENEVLIKTPEEAIETIKSNMPTSGYQMLRESLDMAIIALKEIQQYREIGTVEECLEAAKKNKAKKPLLVSKKKKKIMEGDYVHVICPSCEEEIFSCFLFYPWNDSQRTNKFCKNCGQAILWDENLEEMEDEEN